jgi:hypothetical protein
MAGKKQHYIPRLLLRGFKIPGQTAELLMLHRRGVPPRQVSLGDIFHRKYFYSDLSDSILDDRISHEEATVFGPLLDGLRKGRTLDQQAEREMRRFIVHMMMRTDAARDSMGNLMGSVTQGFVGAVTDNGVVSRLISSGEISTKDIFKKALDEELQLRRKTLTRNQRRMFRKNVLGSRQGRPDVLAEEVTSAAKTHLPGILASSVVTGAQLQRQVLEADLAPSAKVAHLDRLRLSVIDYDPSQPLILGDDPIVGFNADGAVVRTLISMATPETYVLPLTPTRAVVLHACPVGGIPDAERINHASAVLSRQQFVSRASISDTDSLAALIGTYRDAAENIDWKSVLSGETLL